MILVEHRRNTREQLRATPHHHGVEVDIRSTGSTLILQHDAFTPGEDLATWLESYQHRLLILNVKEDGLEDALLELMAQHGIEDFFFLDQPFPAVVRCVERGELRCAVRVSEYEPVSSALALPTPVQWAWVDCFTRSPLTAEDAQRLRAANVKLCVVSPELQGRTAQEEITLLRAALVLAGITPDAVCTKVPARWA